MIDKEIKKFIFDNFNLNITFHYYNNEDENHNYITLLINTDNEKVVHNIIYKVKRKFKDVIIGTYTIKQTNDYIINFYLTNVQKIRKNKIKNLISLIKEKIN